MKIIYKWMRIEANTIKNYEDKARQKALLEGIGKVEGIAERKKQIALKLLLKKDLNRRYSRDYRLESLQEILALAKDIR